MRDTAENINFSLSYPPLFHAAQVSRLFRSKHAWLRSFTGPYPQAFSEKELDQWQL